jgi:serine/threonine protein kinase
MQLIVNGNQFNDPPSLASGGEGEIFSLDAANVAKVYFENVRTDERKQKVLALCNSYGNFSQRHTGQLIAFPEAPAYELAISFDTLVGFSMARYSFPVIEELGFNLQTGRFNESSGIRFDDKSAIQFVYDLCGLIEQLHQSRIVLGDVNPANIMCNPKSQKPVLIDIDAAQIGGFPCRTTHELYNDPQVVSRGKGIGGAFTFDFGTDIFALAIVCFEFLIGVRPHQLHVTPPKKDTENKTLGISSIKCVSAGRDYLAQLGVKYFDCPENDTIVRRLARLKALDPRLFGFFEAVFIKDERDNILFSLPVTDTRHPGHHFFVDSGFKRVIDDELKKRQQRANVQARQGHRQSPVPDSGFLKVIGSLISPLKTAATFKKKSLPPRTDPAAFDIFLQQFGLKTGT